MSNGKWTSNDIYYKLGEVHSTVKATQDEMEDIRDVQSEQSKELQAISKSLDLHLVESKTRRKTKKEQKEYSYKSVGFFITAASVIINVLIEVAKGVFK